MSTADQEAMVYVIERLADLKVSSTMPALFGRHDVNWPAYLGVTEDAITECLTSYWVREIDSVAADARRSGTVSNAMAAHLALWRDASDGGLLWARERAARTWAMFRLPPLEAPQDTAPTHDRANPAR